MHDTAPVGLFLVIGQLLGRLSLAPETLALLVATLERRAWQYEDSQPRRISPAGLDALHTELDR